MRVTILRATGMAVSLAFALAVLPIMSRSVAQQGPAAPQGSASARELLQAMGVDKQFQAVLPLIMNQMVDLFVRQSPRNETEIRETMNALVQRMTDRRAEVIERIALLYAARFSDAELAQMTAFFRSPIGVRLVEAQPELMAQQAVVGRQWGEQIGRELETELRQELKKRGIDL